MSETPEEIRTLAPIQVEHALEILTGLGYSKEYVNELQGNKVLFIQGVSKESFCF